MICDDSGKPARYRPGDTVAPAPRPSSAAAAMVRSFSSSAPATISSAMPTKISSGMPRLRRMAPNSAAVISTPAASGQNRMPVCNGDWCSTCMWKRSANSSNETKTPPAIMATSVPTTDCVFHMSFTGESGSCL